MSRDNDRYTRFQDLDIFSSDDVAAALVRNDPEELHLLAITLALTVPRLSDAQQICVELCGHPNSMVRGNALVSVGHLSRRFRQLDERIVKPVLEKALSDTDAHVRSCAKSAADEIHQFLHWQLQGHTFG